MSFNSSTGGMDWPQNLVWSNKVEVQLLLADIPLIAMGVLGLGSAMLLQLSSRLWVTATPTCEYPDHDMANWHPLPICILLLLRSR